MKLLSFFKSIQYHPSFFISLLVIPLTAMDKKQRKLVKRSDKISALIKKENNKEVIKLITSQKKLTKKQKESREALNTCNKEGELPLNLVLTQGNFALLTTLLNAGANGNTRDENGNTALHQLLLLYSTFIDNNQWSEWQAMFNYLIENSSPNVELSNKAHKTIRDLALDLVNETNHKDENYTKVTEVFRKIKFLAHSLNSSAGGSGDTDSQTPSIPDEGLEGFEFENCPIARMNTLIKSNNIAEFNKELSGQRLKDEPERENHKRKMIASLNAFDVTGTLPLNLIISLQRIALFNRVIKEEELNINAVDGSGNTPLHSIVKMRKEIEDPNKSSPSWTELRQREKSNIEQRINTWKKMFCAIKALNPAPNIENRSGQTPTDLAIGTGKPALVRQLLGLGADPTRSLVSAVQQLRPGMVKLFLNKGASHSFSDKEGNTPLHILILNFQKLNRDQGSQLSQWRATFAALLSANPDLNRFNLEGETPLHLAVNTQDVTTVQSLLEAQANVNARIGEETPSPFDLAYELYNTQQSRKELIAKKQKEIESGSKKSKKKRKETLTSYGVDSDSYNIVMLLKEHGAVGRRHHSQSFGTSSRTSSFDSSSYGSYGSSSMFSSPPSFGSPPHPPSLYGHPITPFPRARTPSMSHSLPQLPAISELPGRKYSVEYSVERLIQSNDSSETSVTFEKQFRVSKKKQELRSQLAEQLKEESAKEKKDRKPLEMRKRSYREQTGGVTTTIRHQKWTQQLKIPKKTDSK